MKNVFLLFAVLTIGMGYSQNVLLPQNSSSSSFNSNGKWVVGGNVGVNIHSEGMDVQIAPRVGYRIVESLELGTSVSYTFRNAKYVSVQTLGVEPYVNYVYQGLVLGASYQYLMSSVKFKNGGNVVKKNENALFISTGYRHRIGHRTYAEIGMRYNVLYNKDTSIFASAFMPYAGITFSL